MLKKKGEFQKAIDCYKKAIQINPNLVQGYINLAKTLDQLDNIYEAKKYYEKALDLNTNSKEVYYKYSNILLHFAIYSYILYIAI